MNKGGGDAKVVILALFSPKMIDSKNIFLKMHSPLRPKKIGRETIAIKFWKMKSRWICSHCISGPENSAGGKVKKQSDFHERTTEKLLDLVASGTTASGIDNGTN